MFKKSNQSNTYVNNCKEYGHLYIYIKQNCSDLFDNQVKPVHTFKTKKCDYKYMSQNNVDCK